MGEIGEQVDCGIKQVLDGRVLVVAMAVAVAYVKHHLTQHIHFDKPADVFFDCTLPIKYLTHLPIPHYLHKQQQQFKTMTIEVRRKIAIDDWEGVRGREVCFYPSFYIGAF